MKIIHSDYYSSATFTLKPAALRLFRVSDIKNFFCSKKGEMEKNIDPLWKMDLE